MKNDIFLLLSILLYEATFKKIKIAVYLLQRLNGLEAWKLINTGHTGSFGIIMFICLPERLSTVGSQWLLQLLPLPSNQQWKGRKGQPRLSASSKADSKGNLTCAHSLWVSQLHSRWYVRFRKCDFYSGWLCAKLKLWASATGGRREWRPGESVRFLPCLLSFPSHGLHILCSDSDRSVPHVIVPLGYLRTSCWHPLEDFKLAHTHTTCYTVTQGTEFYLQCISMPGQEIL